MESVNKSTISYPERILPWIEGIGLVLLVISGMMILLDMQAQELLMISLSTLSVVFFLRANSSPALKIKEGEQLGFTSLLSLVILPKVLWIGSSAATIGILFWILRLEGSAEMLMIGGSALAFGTVLVGAFMTAGSDNLLPIYRPILYRAVPTVIMAIYILLSIPK